MPAKMARLAPRPSSGLPVAEAPAAQWPPEPGGLQSVLVHPGHRRWRLGGWVVLRGIHFTGTGTVTANDCINLGANTFANSGACNAPSGGGGGSGGHIIGG